MERALLDAVAPAPPSEVAAAIEARCGAALDERRALLAAVEAFVPAETIEAAHASRTATTEASPRRWLWAVFAGGAVAAPFWMENRGERQALEAHPVSAPITNTAAAVGAAIPTADAGASRAPATGVSTSAKSPAARARPTVADRPAPTSPPRPRGDDCDPPFVLDENGHKRHERGCFQ